MVKGKTNSIQPDFLNGNISKRIYSKDWSGDPLGPVDNWPQSLRLSLNICLGSNSPVSIFWGSDHFFFYNSAYSKFLGDRHPAVLGQSAREAFEKETWQTISPMLHHVHATGEATEAKDQRLVLPNHGKCCFDLSFSPIPDEDGSVGGVFNIATETTEHVEVAKQRQHIEKALQIETVGVVFFNLDGEITNANDAFLRMSGYDREDLETGKMRWDEMTPPEWMETSKSALIELKETGGTTPYEKQYYRKDGSRWWALFSSKYLEDGKSVEFVLDITERKRNEQLQKEQRKLLELIASDTPLNECLSSLCKTLSQLNKHIKVSIILVDEELKKFKRPVAPDLPSSFADKIENTAVNNHTFSTCNEAIFYGKPVECVDISSDEKWSKEWRDLCLAYDILACHSQPVFDKDRTPVGSLMLCFNEKRKPDELEHPLAEFGARIARIAIERDQADRALRKSKEKYRTLFESMDEGYCIIKVIFDEKDKAVDFRFLETNPAFEKQAGLKDADGKLITDLSDNINERWFEIYAKVALSGEPVRVEQATKGVKNRWFDFYAFRFGDPKERTIAVLFNDTTERKKASEEREQLLREVEAERERLIDIFYQSPSFMAIMREPNHIFERANDRYKQLVGNRELIGKSVLEALPEVESQGFVEILDQVYRTGKEFKASDERILLNSQNEGTPKEHFINFVYQPLRDANGVITGIFVQGIDVTHRKQVENELMAMNETLEERVEERTASLLAYQEQLRSLASQLSQAEEQQRHRLAAELHDNLGQMLAVGKMKADLLQKGSLPDHLAAEVGELRDLVDDALVYTRELMSDLKPPPSLNKEDIKETIEWLAKKMEKHGLKVIIEDDEQQKQINEEIKTTLIQAVRELLFNVIKHAEVDEAVVSISRVDDFMQVIVEDTGKGFDPETNDVASFKDGGFGLFNIRERMDVLGGSMKISSEPGKGMKVKLLAPLKEEQNPNESDSSDETESKPRSPKKNHKVKVLLVDDNQMMRKGLRNIVDEQDDLMVIAEASNGEEAVKLAHETSPDIVVMDVNMPVMNGIDATQKIMSEMTDLRVIGLSLHSHKNVVESMRSVGASAYLTKNEAIETLCATIRSEAALARE